MTGFQYGIVTAVIVILIVLFLYDQTRLNKQEKTINNLQVGADDQAIKNLVENESDVDRLKYLNSRDPSDKS